MNTSLKKLTNSVADHCVTIILNTHRAGHDNKMDPIQFKNLIREAESRLREELDKQSADRLVEKLEKMAAEIDHTYNLDSLILFANEDIAEFYRLAIPVVDRVVIDRTFATRDLIRAIHQESNYHVLILTRSRAHLVEALNDGVMAEAGPPFPMDNPYMEEANRMNQPDAIKQTTLLKEFFNNVDKEVNKVRTDRRIPILVCATDENFHAYMEVADDKRGFYDTNLNRDGSDDNVRKIVADAWELVREFRKKTMRSRADELKRAVGANRFLSDTNDIWRSIQEGRVETIFIERGRFQPAVIENGLIRYVSEDRREDPGVVDDIYDEMIEENLRFGGDVVFLPKGELDKFNGLGATTRY
ncbi:MAG TPA: hypothetical protein VKY29_07520 [Cryomorphaceae bacterium]|nr:hypothetical protein [Cryomorphaceae bacterium]